MSVERQESGQRPGRLWVWVLAFQARRRAIAEAFGVWGERRRTRRQLTRLSDHMLKDIGVGRAEVDRESGKAFWRK